MSDEMNADIEGLKTALRERMEDMETAELYALVQALNWKSWIGSASNVMCSLQNNPKLIPLSEAVQCRHCSRYYCKDHRLANCPHCKQKL